MPQSGDTSNRMQNKTEASKELNAWLTKRVPEQVLPITARSPLHISMPPLVSYIRQKFRNLGESSRRLTTWVIGHGGLASNVSRAIRLPLLSRAFNYICTKPTSIPPVWQRMLDLPWFRQHRKRTHRFTKATDTAVDRKPNTSLLPNELYPTMLPQTLSDTEEEQLADETDETYQAATGETYPLISSELASPPMIKKELTTTAKDFPHAAGATTLPLHTRKMADRYYPKELTQPLHITRKERPVDKADETYRTATGETYPVISSELTSPPVINKELTTTANDFPHAAGATTLALHAMKMADRYYPKEPTQPLHITRKELIQPLNVTRKELIQPLHVTRKVRPVSTADETYRAATGETYPFISGNLVSPPETIGRLSDVTPELPHHAHQIPEPDHGQIRGAEDGLARVNRQPQHTYQNQRLSRVLKAIIQRMALRRRPMEARSHTTGEGISEGHASSLRHFYYPKVIETDVESSSAAAKQPALPFVTTIPKVGALYGATVQVIHTLRTLASSKQPAMLERESLIDTLTAQRQPASIKEESERPGSSAIQRTVDKITRPMPDSLPSETSIYSESSGVPTGRIAPQRAPQTSQVQQREPLIGPSLKRISKKIGMIHTAKDISTGLLGPAMVNLEPPQYGITGQVFERGPTGEYLFYPEPSSAAGPDVQSLPAQESIHNKMVLPMPKLFKSTGYTDLPDKTENYRFLPSQESLPFSPDYKYTSKEVPEMPSVSLVQPKIDFSVASKKGMISDMPDIMPEPISSWNQGAPELVLAPTGYTHVMAESEPTSSEPPEPGVTEIGEGATTPDIDDIANDVYIILKRRLSAERERALGVH